MHANLNGFTAGNSLLIFIRAIRNELSIVVLSFP